MKKGKYVRKLARDYVVLDLETTGLSRFEDEIIEIAMVRVRNGEICDTFQTLIRPRRGYIPSFITGLTGISWEMVKNAPTIDQVMPAALEFLGDDLIVGHNTSFDVGFLAQQADLYNNYADTVQFCRKLYPNLSSHTLSVMSKHLSLSVNTHRAMADVETTYQLYEHIQDHMDRSGLHMSDLFSTGRTRKPKKGTKDSL